MQINFSHFVPIHLEIGCSSECQNSLLCLD